MIKHLWKWIMDKNDFKYEVTVHVGIMYVFGVPVLPLLDITIKRVDRT